MVGFPRTTDAQVYHEITWDDEADRQKRENIRFKAISFYFTANIASHCFSVACWCLRGEKPATITTNCEAPCSGRNARFLAHFFGQEVVGVALATTVDEAFTLACDRVIEPTWKVGEAKARFFGKEAVVCNMILSTFEQRIWACQNA